MKLLVARNVKETWNLTKIVDIVNQELGAREICAVKTTSEVNDSDIKSATGEISTNCSSNLASILLQTAEIVLENPFNKKEVRNKVLLD